MASAGVKSHTRTVNGKTVRVRQHKRKVGPSQRRAKTNARRALRNARRGKHGMAIKLSLLAGLEIGAWAVLQGTVLMLTTFVVVFVGTLTVVLGGSPKRRRRSRSRRSK